MGEPVVGEIYAAREFRVTRAGELTSLHAPTAWKQGEHQAVCHRVASQQVPHSAPNEDCLCGFYAYTAADPTPDSTAIMGVVACYGTVLEGELGVRAEKTRIVALHFGEAVPWKAHDQARNRYRDVEIFDDYTAMLDHFGIKPASRRAAKTAEGIVYPVRDPAPKATQIVVPQTRKHRGVRRAVQGTWKALSGISAVGAELMSVMIRAAVMTAFLAFAVGLSIPQSAPYLTQEPWGSWAPVVAAIAVAAFARLPQWDTILQVLLKALLTSSFVGTLILLAQNATEAGAHGFGSSLAWLTVLLVAGLAKGREFWWVRFGTSDSRTIETRSSVSPAAGAAAIVGRGFTTTGLMGSAASARPFQYAKLPSGHH